MKRLAFASLLLALVALCGCGTTQNGVNNSSPRISGSVEFGAQHQF